MAPGNLQFSEHAQKPIGQIEFIFIDRNGNEVHRIEENLVKIFAKEMLSHRLPSSEVWDPEANSGAGDYVATNLDNDEEFAPRYILLGASFDEDGVPLDVNDTRYYTLDPISGTFEPVRLGPGAEFEGGLINAIPIAEPDRPLVKVEGLTYEATYQPAGSPLLEADVRAINNIVVFESRLRLDEYNGLGVTNSDFFTITEVALAGGKKISSLGACEKTPREIFLEPSSDGNALLVNAAGTDVISIDSAESEVNLIKQGDQIKIVAAGGTVGSDDSLGQTNPFYLVLSKQSGGRDIQLDRVPVDSVGDPITGQLGVFRDTLRIFSHRILSSPVKKSDVFEILIRWRIIMS